MIKAARAHLRLLKSLEAGVCKVVKCEPTEEMFRAAKSTGFTGDRQNFCWDYMAALSAAEPFDWEG